MFLKQRTKIVIAFGIFNFPFRIVVVVVAFLLHLHVVINGDRVCVWAVAALDHA